MQKCSKNLFRESKTENTPNQEIPTPMRSWVSSVMKTLIQIEIKSDQ